MNSGNIWRIVILVSLILLAQLQLTLSQRTKVSVAKTFTTESVDAEIDSMPFDLPFPIINKTASEKEVQEAEKLMKLPVWSKGYLNCNDSKSEVSCFEVVRAAKAIHEYEKTVNQGFTKGQIYVDAKPYKLEDRMTMLYHAFQIGIATSREVYIDKSLFPFNLSNIIKDSKGKIAGIELPTDYQFGCANVGQRFQKLLIANVTWPQALYTHHIIAPYLRENFGFHAAYFIGNYLFGTSETPEEDCLVGDIKFAVEAYKYHDNSYMMSLWEFTRYTERCGVIGDAAVITNDKGSGFENTNYKNVNYVEPDEGESFVCNFRKIMSAEYIVHTFGSRYGFWAAAMQGRKGGFVNTIDRICVNVTNSQCGSLFHTYCPEQLSEIFRTNNRMFVCGPNVNDVRLYIDYLLW